MNIYYRDSDEKDKEAFKDTVTTISQDINGLFGLIWDLHGGTRGGRGGKKILAAATEDCSQDISVAFFGLDWAHTYRILCRIAAKVDQMLEEPTSSSLLTLVMPHHLLGDLVKLEADLHAHVEAVLRGRTNYKHKEHIK